MGKEALSVEASKKLNIMLWTSVAAAGVIVVAAVARWKARSSVGTQIPSRLRDVQDVLADCYQKIREIEEHLPVVLPTRGVSWGSQSVISNGKTVLEA